MDTIIIGSRNNNHIIYWYVLRYDTVLTGNNIVHTHIYVISISHNGNFLDYVRKSEIDYTDK